MYVRLALGQVPSTWRGAGLLHTRRTPENGRVGGAEAEKATWGNTRDTTGLVAVMGVMGRRGGEWYCMSLECSVVIACPDHRTCAEMAKKPRIEMAVDGGVNISEGNGYTSRGTQACRWRIEMEKGLSPVG